MHGGNSISSTTAAFLTQQLESVVSDDQLPLLPLQAALFGSCPVELDTVEDIALWKAAVPNHLRITYWDDDSDSSYAGYTRATFRLKRKYGSADSLQAQMSGGHPSDSS